MPILSDPRSPDDHQAPPRASASDPLVDLIRGQLGMAERLIAQHVDDGHGRCAVCRGGAQTGRYTWPCTTARAAATACAAGPLPSDDRPGEVGREPADFCTDGADFRGQVRQVPTDFTGTDPAGTCHGGDDFRVEIRHAVADLDATGGAR